MLSEWGGLVMNRRLFALSPIESGCGRAIRKMFSAAFVRIAAAHSPLQDCSRSLIVRKSLASNAFLLTSAHGTYSALNYSDRIMKTHAIYWKSAISGQIGTGTKLFEKKEAERLATELNEGYPDIDHEAVIPVPAPELAVAEAV
jgi:hypothetical protein